MKILMLFLLLLVSASPEQSARRSANEYLLVKGRVCDASTCSGLARLVVKFIPPETPASIRVGSARPVVVTATAGDGTFQVSLPGVGEYYVTVSQGAQQLYGRVINVATNEPVLIGLIRKGTMRAPIPCAMPEAFKNVRCGGLALLESGMIILDGYNRQLLQAGPTGVRTIPTGLLNEPLDIASAQISGHKFVLVVNSGNTATSIARAYTANGSSWDWWRPSIPGVFSAIAADPNGQEIYLGIMTAMDFSIVKMDAQSVLQRRGQPFLNVSSISNQGSNRADSWGPFAIDHAKNRLFVANSKGAIYTVDLGHPRNDWARLPLTHNLGSPNALTYDRVVRTLYIGAGRHLWAVRLDTTKPTEAEFLPNNFKNVTALVVDNDGRLWIGDSGARSIFVVSTAGHVVQTLH